MLLVDGSGLPLSIDVDSASPGEVTLIEPLLEQAVVNRFGSVRRAFLIP